MTGQIIFFEKNKIDITSLNVALSVTDVGAYSDGSAVLNLLGDRRNSTSWMTTDSSDASNTTIEIDTIDPQFIDTFALVRHNLKSYAFEYFDGAGWQNFSTPVNPTNDEGSVSIYEFDEVLANRFRLTITGTQVADADKRIAQLILTKKIGRLIGWPKIRRPIISTSRSISRMLSGKANLTEGDEVFSCTLDVENWRIQEDIDLINTLYNIRKGTLIYLNGARPDQFSINARGYRPEDFYLVRPSSEWNPELFANYKTGLRLSVSFVEVSQ